MTGDGGGRGGSKARKVSSAEREARRRNRLTKIERQKAKIHIENESKPAHEKRAKSPGNDEVKHPYWFQLRLASC